VILFGVEKSIEVYNSVRKRPRRSGRAEEAEGNGDENWVVDEVVLYQGCAEEGGNVL
jgi:hypothetical protein